jgi:hypothetical protein
VRAPRTPAASSSNGRSVVNAALDPDAECSQVLLAARLQRPAVLVLRKEHSLAQYGHRRIAAQKPCPGTKHLRHPPPLVMLLGFRKSRIEDPASGCRVPRLDHHVSQQTQPVRHASVLAGRPKLVDALLDANDTGLTATHPAVDHDAPLAVVAERVALAETNEFVRRLAGARAVLNQLVRRRRVTQGNCKAVGVVC